MAKEVKVQFSIWTSYSYDLSDMMKKENGKGKVGC
jgi:hypothetical protein